MTDDISSILKTLIELSRVDKNLLQVRAEAVRFEKQVKEKSDKLATQEKEYERRNAIMLEKERTSAAESASIKSDQDHLIERRKALGSLGNYKVQEAASREIDAHSRQLSIREGANNKEKELVARMSQSQEQLFFQNEEIRKEVSDLTDDKNAAAQSQKLRRGEYETEQRALLSRCDPDLYKIYQRVLLKHPENPVVPVLKGMCGGCFLKASPQFLVSLQKADKLVQCSGCQRILYLEPAEKTTGAAT